MATAAKGGAKAPTNLLGQLNAASITAIVVMLAAIVLALYYVLLYTPLSEELDREATRKTQVAQQLASAQADLNHYNDDVAELARMRVRTGELQRVLPDTSDIPGFMASINTLAEASNLVIDRVAPIPEVRQQYYVRVPVSLAVRGDYMALARFFRAVSQLPRVINMENVSLLRAPDNAPGENRLSAHVLATTFRSTTPLETTSTPGAARQGASR